MTKKTLDENSIVNELTGQSAFFQEQHSPPPVSTPASDRATPIKPL